MLNLFNIAAAVAEEEEEFLPESTIITYIIGFEVVAILIVMALIIIKIINRKKNAVEDVSNSEVQVLVSEEEKNQIQELDINSGIIAYDEETKLYYDDSTEEDNLFTLSSGYVENNALSNLKVGKSGTAFNNEEPKEHKFVYAYEGMEDDNDIELPAQRSSEGPNQSLINSINSLGQENIELPKMNYEFSNNSSTQNVMPELSSASQNLEDTKINVFDPSTMPKPISDNYTQVPQSTTQYNFAQGDTNN